MRSTIKGYKTSNKITIAEKKLFHNVLCQVELLFIRYFMEIDEGEFVEHSKTNLFWLVDIKAEIDSLFHDCISVNK